MAVATANGGNFIVCALRGDRFVNVREAHLLGALHSGASHNPVRAMRILGVFINAYSFYRFVLTVHPFATVYQFDTLRPYEEDPQFFNKYVLATFPAGVIFYVVSIAYFMYPFTVSKQVGAERV